MLVFNYLSKSLDVASLLESPLSTNISVSCMCWYGLLFVVSPKRHYWLVLDQYHPEYEHDVFSSTWKKEQSHRVDQNSIREKESVITGLIMGLYTHWRASFSPYLLGLDVESSGHQPRCSIKTITAQNHIGAEADKSRFFFFFPAGMQLMGSFCVET